MIYCKYMKLNTPCQIFLRRISQSEIQNSAASVPFKKGSDFVKQTHQNLTFRNFADRFSRAKRGRERKHWLAAHGAARQAQVRNPLRF